MAAQCCRKRSSSSSNNGLGSVQNVAEVLSHAASGCQVCGCAAAVGRSGAEVMVLLLLLLPLLLPLLLLHCWSGGGGR